MTKMPSRMPSRMPSLILAAMLLPALVPAQQETPASAPQTPFTITLSFPGGSLADFLGRVRALDGRINIVATEIASEVTLPAVELRDAAVLSALQSVSSIVPDPFKVRAQMLTSPGGNPVYTVEVDVRGPTPKAQEVHVFSLAMLIRPLPGDSEQPKVAMEAKTVLSALEAGAHVMGGQFDLRYHEESGLLFVSGTSKQINLVQEVLGNLEREQQRMRNELQRAKGLPSPAGAGKQGGGDR
jgi:hypothetical protein